MPEHLPAEPQRKEIFLALVEAQDRGMTVTESREEVAERFGVSESQVRTIEREGLDKGWPPL
jgi:DNA-directed RNA polymerase sigma subunit (sigma70/sigma32)